MYPVRICGRYDDYSQATLNEIARVDFLSSIRRRKTGHKY